MVGYRNYIILQTRAVKISKVLRKEKEIKTTTQ